MAGSSILGNSAVPQYVKLTATAILATTYLSSLVVATIDMVTDATIPSVVTFILGTGLSLALGVLGLHQGASLAEAAPPNLTVTPTATLQPGQIAATSATPVPTPQPGGPSDASTATA